MREISTKDLTTFNSANKKVWIWAMRIRVILRDSVKFKIKIPFGEIRYFELNHVLEISPISDK